MKASLLLSLGLLLVLLASPSRTASMTDKDSSVDPSSKPPVTPPSPDPSSKPPVTPPSPDPSSKPPVTPPSPDPSSKPPVTPPSPDPSSKPPVTPPSPDPSSKPPVTPPSPDPSSKPPVTPPSPDPSSKPPVTPPSPDPSSKPPVTPPSPDPSSKPPVTPPSPDPSSKPPVTPPSPDPSSKPPVTPQSPDPSSKPPVTPQSPDPSSKPPVTPQSPDPSSKPPVTPQSPDPSSKPPVTPQSPDPSSKPPVTPQSPDPSSKPPVTPQSPDVSPQTTSPVITPGPRDPCVIDPCKGTASCVNLHSERVCLCSEGYYYKTSSCEKGKTFPGELTMKVPEPSDLEDKNSQGYQDFHNYVVNFLKNTFNKPGDGYGQTIILKVSDSSSLSARSAMRAAEKTVYVSVVNMFEERTTQNESTVAAAIEKAVQSNGNMTSYTRQDRCDYYGCEKDQNNCLNGFQCKCKPGLARPNPLVPYCLSQECPETCKAEDKKQCLIKNNGALECVCMPGYQKTTDEKCEECPFGYSGMDCKDQFQLILTIVGTIAGALILILLIALIVSASSKKKKKDMEEQNLIDNDFHNVRMQQTGFSNSSFSNFGADNSIFPKVRTGTPKQTQNPYGNQRSMPHPDY